MDTFLKVGLNSETVDTFLKVGLNSETVDTFLKVGLNSETVDTFPAPPVSSGSSKRKFKEKDSRDSVATRQDTKVGIVPNVH